jgi:hypothetical protein
VVRALMKEMQGVVRKTANSVKRGQAPQDPERY